jgi:succinate dehydrogenase flavin-adding protein (antitoxin of CptAB toxin-antitoxin module)
MDEQAMNEFEAVLEVPEPDLLAWYMGQAEVPTTQLSPTLSLILDFKVYD